jgi:hypothetical protein
VIVPEAHGNPNSALAADSVFPKATYASTNFYLVIKHLSHLGPPTLNVAHGRRNDLFIFAQLQGLF